MDSLMMNKKGFFWLGVKLWVKLSVSLALCLFLILMIPVIGVHNAEDMKHTFSAIAIFITTFSIIYLIYMGTCKTLRFKRRGFWLACILNIVGGFTVGYFVSPMAGVAFALLFAAGAFRYSSRKIEKLAEELSHG